jgi:hypothetical protein
MPTEWEGVERAQDCTRACSVVQIAKDETAKGEVKRDEGGRAGRGEIRGASFERDVSGVLSA